MKSALNCGRKGVDPLLAQVFVQSTGEQAEIVEAKEEEGQKNRKSRGLDGKEADDTFRVVGGKLAYQNEIPWQVLLVSPQNDNTLIQIIKKVSLLRSDGSWAGCGAALLSCSPVIVITGAHCVARQVYNNYIS